MAYPRNAFKLDRKKSANLRAEERAKRSKAQQIEVLDQRLGKGVGAVKERERLS